MNKLGTILLINLLLWSPAYADLYLELGLESGGEELAATTAGESLNAGGGLKMAAGIQNTLDPQGTASMRLAVGYLTDSINAYDGKANVDALTFDALYLMNSGPHSLGIGATMHLSPQYEEYADGYPPFKIDFDDAIGPLLQYSYHPFYGFEVGARFSLIEYETDGFSYDASSFGVFLSNGF
jgi:hypothetical protein